MRASTAYFAGAGTVIAAIVGGIGGGLLFADMISPKTPKAELTRLEQRMSSQPIQVKAGAEPAVNPTTPPSPTTPASPEQPAQSAVVPAAPQTPAPITAAAPAPAPSTPVSASTSDTAATAHQSAATDAPEPRTSPPAQKQAATAPEDSLAKAKDVDLKRAASERRRSERRQQWSEKRRYQRRENPDQELREVEAKVREETETTGFFGEAVRAEGRRIRIIDLD